MDAATLESPIQDLADFNASASIVLQTLLQLIPHLRLPWAEGEYHGHPELHGGGLLGSLQTPFYS